MLARTPLKRKKGLRCGAPAKKNHARKPGKPRKPSLKLLAKQTEKLCMAFYRGLPCVICGLPGYGHHCVPKSRCRAGRHNPRNLVPLCNEHHKFSNEIAPHSINPMAVGRFQALLRDRMPLRYQACEELDHRAKCGEKYASSEIEADNAFWVAIVENQRSYEFVCETVDVEARPCDPSSTTA